MIDFKAAEEQVDAADQIVPRRRGRPRKHPARSTPEEAAPLRPGIVQIPLGPSPEGIEAGLGELRPASAGQASLLQKRTFEEMKNGGQADSDDGNASNQENVPGNKALQISIPLDGGDVRISSKPSRKSKRQRTVE